MGEGEDAQLSLTEGGGDTVTVGGYSAAHLSLVTVPGGGGGDHHPERYCSCLGVASHSDSGSVDSADHLSILCLHYQPPLRYLDITPAMTRVFTI